MMGLASIFFIFILCYLRKCFALSYLHPFTCEIDEKVCFNFILEVINPQSKENLTFDYQQIFVSVYPKGYDL
jgi:hypothetical protein